MPVGRYTPPTSATQQATPVDPPAAVATDALSPWPTAAGPSRDAAIARLRAAVAGRASETDAAAAALGMMAAARVEREAPSAPQSVRDEAVVRYAGYFAQADFSTIRKEDMGPRSVEYVTTHANAWRLSGAAGLLSRWVQRRAGGSECRSNGRGEPRRDRRPTPTR